MQSQTHTTVCDNQHPSIKSKNVCVIMLLKISNIVILLRRYNFKVAQIKTSKIRFTNNRLPITNRTQNYLHRARNCTELKIGRLVAVVGVVRVHGVFGKDGVDGVIGVDGVVRVYGVVTGKGHIFWCRTFVNKISFIYIGDKS